MYSRVNWLKFARDLRTTLLLGRCMRDLSELTRKEIDRAVDAGVAAAQAIQRERRGVWDTQRFVRNLPDLEAVLKEYDFEALEADESFFASNVFAQGRWVCVRIWPGRDLELVEDYPLRGTRPPQDGNESPGNSGGYGPRYEGH